MYRQAAVADGESAFAINSNFSRVRMDRKIQSRGVEGGEICTGCLGGLHSRMG